MPVLFPLSRGRLSSCRAALRFSRTLAFTAAAVIAAAPAAPPVKEADISSAIQDVESLSRGLTEGLAAYRENLKKAMEIYGKSLGRDIQTGDVDQSGKMRLTLFAAIMRTAGVRLDPDPFRYWDDVRRKLDSYDATLDKARRLMTQTNVIDAASRENIPAKELPELRRRWQSASRQAEAARDKALAQGPMQLKPGQTVSARATEGQSLHINFFGIQLGSDLGNIIALAQLTYSGKIDGGDLFLLTMLTGRYGKTRVDTLVKPCGILVYSDTRDALHYGYAVTSHSYSGYTAYGVRVAGAAAAVRDWVWKDLPASATVLQPSLAELEKAIRKIQDSRRAMERSVEAFQRLASEAVRQNDQALREEAKAAHRKARLPEQDLRVYFQDMDLRARLYAWRALAAGDRRFLDARSAVAIAQRQAERSITEGRELFRYFNRIPVHAAPQLPWSRIDRLAVELMIAAEDAQRAAARSDESLPAIRPGEDTAITRIHSSPQVIVAQVNRGGGEIVEHIVRDVHWAIKGIERREYTSERIKASPKTGIHEVQSVQSPTYIQGPGGIGQVFQSIASEF